MYCYRKLRFALLAASVLMATFVFAQNADFSISNSSQCVTSNSFTFTNLTTGGSATYSWSFGDGTSSADVNPVKTYSGAGIYNVQLIATIAGSDHYASKTVFVNPLPQCSFNYLSPTGIGNAYTFQSTSSISNGSMTYSWDFGDNSIGTGSNPSHTYSSNGAYNVTLTVTSDKGCVASVTKNIVVIYSSSPSVCPDSIYNFCINSLHQCLLGNNFLLTNTSTAPAGTTYSWNFGDGTSSVQASPVKNYNTPGNYVITLVSTNGSNSCFTTKSVTIDNPPAVSVTGNTCIGNTLTANVIGNGINNISWKNAGTAISSAVPQWSAIPQTVAGGNGAGSMVYPVPIGATVNQLTVPKGLYLYNNDLFITDNYTSRITQWIQNNSSSISKCYNIQITGIGIDCHGNIYIVDDICNCVQKWAPGATSGVIVAGGNGAGSAANQLDNPRGNLYIDNAGNIYINDTYNNRIQMWAPGATAGVTVAGGNNAGAALNQLNNPQGFFVDDAGNIYVSDARNYRIMKFPAGSTSATYGTVVAGGNGRGMGLNQFYNPFSVFVDKAGNIYVDDLGITSNHRVQLWTPGATAGITILEVLGSYPDYSIATVWVDINNGDIYVSDEANSRVQKYSIASTSNTFTPVTPGTYTAVVSAYNGCSVTSTPFTVGAGTTKASFTVNTNSQCLSGNSFTFTNTSTSCGTVSYLWSFGDGTTSTATNPTKNYTTAGRYLVTLKLTNAGVDYYDNQCEYIVVNTTPQVTLNNLGNICSGLDTLQLTAPTDATKIAWYNGGVAIDTVFASLSDTAVTVATSNGLNGFTLDDSGNIYVIHVYGSWQVLKYAAGTNNSTIVAGGNGNGSAANQLVDPWGVTVDKCGNLYVSDYANNRIQKFPAGSTGATNATTVAGGNGQGNATNQLSMPYGMFIDNNKNLYVADAGNSRIMMYAPDSTNGTIVAGGNGMGSAANQLNNPFGVFVDNNGYLYVADAGNNRIQKFAPGSTIASNGITVAGGNGSGTAANQLSYPNNVFVDADGNVFVSDNNNRIQKFPAGSTSTTNGITIAGGHGHGAVSNQLSGPWGIFIDKNGNVFVGDESNHRVQKFSPHINTNFVPSGVGSYTAVATNYNGCTGTTNVLNVTTTATPSFIVNTVVQCLNGNNFTFTNTSTVCGVASYLWNFGDGTTTTSANTNHTYSSAGTYNVTLKVTLSGIDYSSSQIVVVGAAPVASFNTLAGTGAGNAYTFISSSTISSGYISTYSWNFGDGTTDATSNPNHTFAVNGTYNVKLVVTSNTGCIDSITHSIVVTLSGGTGGIPIPSYTVNTAQQCFNGNSFAFTNTSTVPPGTTYLWAFGDGTISTASNPSHSYAGHGNYNVTLIATYNGIDHYYAQTVIVKPMPVSSFVYFNNKGSLYGYSFISNSTIASGNMNYSWNFGDGTTDSIINPDHTYTTDGNMVVKLVVTSDGGCKDSTTHTILFCPSMNNKAFRINAANACLSTNFWGVQNYYGNSLGYPMSYLWDYGDGSTSTLQSPPSYAYTTAGQHVINLTVTLAYPGCPVLVDHYNDTVTVWPQPDASFGIEHTTNMGGTYAVNDTNIMYSPDFHDMFNWLNTQKDSTSWYTLSFGDGAQDVVKGYNHGNPPTGQIGFIGLYHYSAPGVYHPQLKVLDIHGCSDSIAHTIIINPPAPKASIALHIPSPVITPSLAYYYDINYASTSTINYGSIVSSEWEVSALDVWSGNWMPPMYSNTIAGNMPTINDSIYKVTVSLYSLSPSYRFRLIVTSDMGVKDTTYAYFGTGVNSGYTTFKNPANNMAVIPDASIGIFPNPAIQETNIVAQVDKYTIATLLVYNAVGQTVLNKKVSLLSNIKQSVNIKVNNWANGIYNVMLKDEQGNIIGRTKFIKVSN